MKSWIEGFRINQHDLLDQDLVKSTELAVLHSMCILRPKLHDM